MQYLETKERAGETIVADCVRGAAEYVTEMFKVGRQDRLVAPVGAY